MGFRLLPLLNIGGFHTITANGSLRNNSQIFPKVVKYSLHSIIQGGIFNLLSS